MKIIEMLRQAPDLSDDKPDIRKWAVERIAKAKAVIALSEKLITELDEVGSEKFHRLLEMANGTDPDAPKSEATLKVGPHGPGCECSPEDEPEQECVKH